MDVWWEIKVQEHFDKFLDDLFCLRYNQNNLMKGDVIVTYKSVHSLIDLNDYAKKFRALADPLRLQIILLLKEGEKCVCDLCEEMDMQQSKVSYHLKILQEVNLISCRHDRTWSYYRLKEDVISWVTEECCEFIKLKS